ncbi:MAG TPA: hypothetical protein VK901_18350, partial [Nitrospiraceae bacterium]|nr:hypothetical protein [Nitrospiraceae bacterium]
MELWKKERVAYGQQFKLIEENTDKSAHKMVVQSEEREEDGVEVVETSCCGGSVTVIFNPFYPGRPEMTKPLSRSVTAPPPS